MNSHEEFSLQKLQSFLDQQRNILDCDRTSLRYFQDPKHTSEVGSQDEKLSSINSVKNKCISSHSTSPCNEDTKEKMMKSDKLDRHIINSRDNEKEKLISALSVPKKRHSCSSIKVTNKNYPSPRHNNSNFTATDAREKEKDRLAAIFASSGYQFSKSSQQTSKNLNSDIGFEDDKQVINKTESSKMKNVSDDKTGSQTKNVLPRSISKYVSNNQNVKIPRILVSECDQESQRNTDIHYRPVSPRVSVDSHCPSPNRQLKDAVTQTEWDDETTNGRNCNLTERRCNTPDNEEPRSISPSFRYSFNPKCFEGLNEKEIKEHIYREDLRRQIEEKNKLKEEIRQREAEEEAKLELKIKHDQEKMKRQYEEEMLQRLQLALKRKEQEELLQQRLVLEKQRAVQENMTLKHEMLNKKISSPTDTSITHSANLMSSPRTPTTFTSKVLVDAHEELRQPLLELQPHEPSEEIFKHYPPNRDVPSRKVDDLHSNRKSLRDSKSRQRHETKRVSSRALNALAHCPKAHNVQQPLNEPSTYSICDQTREVDRLLKEPVLPPETYPDLPPMSPPLLHATIPPLTASLHPNIDPSRPLTPLSPRLHKSNSEILEDRWKVPYVERYNAAPSDVFTKHRHSVLTQLGAFRRHLQQERLRMQQRVQDESL